MFDHLAVYYAAQASGKSASNLVPYTEMAERLSSEDAASRKEAAEYLYALCLQTEADDRMGRTPKPRGMKLGGGPNDYGAELRGWMARELARATFHQNGEDALEAACWLYKNDTWPEHREDGAKALARIRTREADKLFAEMINSEEAHFGILTIALKQAAERRLIQATNQIRLLCRHYNASVREAAVAAASRLGLRDVAPYDPLTDLGPRIEQWLRTALTIIPEKVPADSKWYRFTIPAAGGESGSPEGQPDVEICGWLVGEDGDVYRVIDWRGQPRTWSRKQAQLHADSLSDFSERMVKIREKYNTSNAIDEKTQLQEAMGIRTFMMSSDSTWGGTLPEVLAAAWSLERGDRQTCVRLMIPLMTDVSDERLFLDHFRDDLAVEIDQRMLTAFTTRDYDEALRLAKILIGPWFEGFAHQDRAKGLAATLPHRSEDFKTLTLVSPQAWEAFQKEFSRQRQIEYLAERLRLIRAAQWSIPGGIWYSDAQYELKVVEGQEKPVEPTFFPEGQEAINPYSELLRLNLTGAELLPLVPYLQSSDYILAYDLYRFIPMNPYRLHKVSWVVASIFNAVSQADVVDVAILESPTEGARQQHLDQIRKWCEGSATVAHADRLAKTVKEAKEWQDVQLAFWSLLELDEDRAVKLIVTRCDGEVARQAELARLLCLLDRKEYLPRAREWMRDRVDETRFWGALFVLKHADRKHPEGLEIVLAQLAEQIEGKGRIGVNQQLAPDAADLVDAAMEALVVIDDPRVRTFLSTYCGAKPYRDFDPSSATLQRLFQAGSESAFDRLIYHLNDSRPAYEGSKQPRSDDWLWWLSFWRYKNPPQYLHDPPKEKREEAYADLKRWLGTQFRLIKDGRSSDIIKEDRQVPWGDWKVYSSGWVRRI